MSYYMKLNKIEKLDDEFLPDKYQNYQELKNLLQEYRIKIIAMCLNPESKFLVREGIDFYHILNTYIRIYINAFINKVKYELKQKWEEEKDGMEFTGSSYRGIDEYDFDYLYQNLIENLFIGATTTLTVDKYEDPEKYDEKYNDIAQELEIEDIIYYSFVKKLIEKYGKQQEE